jgi:glucose/mannose-6-phosphate isomerase
MKPDHSARHYGIDSERMIDKALGLPDQMAEAWGLAGVLAECMPAGAKTLIICGMGGSAIGGQLLRDLIAGDSDVSVHIERGYTLPAFAGTDTPVVCVSYSGNTEEVLGCFRDGLKRGSPMAVISSGGILTAEAEKAGVPVLRIPGGMPPRAALGYLFTPLLKLASCWGFCAIEEEEFRAVLRKTRKLLDKCSLEADLAGNTPMQLAKRLYGKIPLVYSGNRLLVGAAYRWKCQFNENSKCMAFVNNFPELGHNEIMGWDSPAKILQEIFLVMLTDVDDHPRVIRRMDVTYDMLEPLAAGAIKLNSVGGPGFSGRLARLLSIIALGDLTSIYLAVESGKDPTPIDKIDEIKELLGSEDE